MSQQGTKLAEVLTRRFGLKFEASNVDGVEVVSAPVTSDPNQFSAFMDALVQFRNENHFTKEDLPIGELQTGKSNNVVFYVGNVPTEFRANLQYFEPQLKTLTAKYADRDYIVEPKRSDPEKFSDALDKAGFEKIDFRSAQAGQNIYHDTSFRVGNNPEPAEHQVMPEDRNPDRQPRPASGLPIALWDAAKENAEQLSNFATVQGIKLDQMEELQAAARMDGKEGLSTNELASHLLAVSFAPSTKEFQGELTSKVDAELTLSEFNKAAKDPNLQNKVAYLEQRIFEGATGEALQVPPTPAPNFPKATSIVIR